MTKDSFNMRTFRHSIYLNCTVEEAYNMAGTASGLTKWFIGSAVYESPEGEKRKFGDYVHAGDEFEWEWLQKDLSVSGRVIEAEKNSRFKFTFGNSFIVTVTVREERGRILFTLLQEYAQDAEPDNFAHINCCVCWGFFITNLKSVIEYGNDLRETLVQNDKLVNR